MDSDPVRRNSTAAATTAAAGQDDASGRGHVDSLTDPPTIPEESYELRIVQSLRRIIRAVELHSRKLAQNHQITGPQLACLRALRENGPQTTTRLARLVYLSPSTVVGIVDRLEEKGLLTRTRSTRDRRQVQIVITETGEKLAGSTPSPLQDTLTRALRELPELEQISITLALEKVVHLMEARKIDAAPVLDIGSFSWPPENGAKPAK